MMSHRLNQLFGGIGIHQGGDPVRIQAIGLVIGDKQSRHSVVIGYPNNCVNRTVQKTGQRNIKRGIAQ